MAKFDELHDDFTVKSVRKTRWANPNDYLILPPVIHTHNCRGVWCTLHGYDGNEEGKITDVPLLVFTAKDDEDDWEVHSRYEPN